MASSLRSDGKAVDIAYNYSTPKEKGNPVLIDGFHGILMDNASSGETVAIEIATREHEITVPGGVTAAKGAILYITSAGVITNTKSGNRAFLKVTEAKDSNNIVWGVILPQPPYASET